MVGNDVIAVIQVAQSLDNVNDTLEHLIIVLLVIMPLLIALGSVGGYLLAAHALAPIDAITRTAQRISSRDLHERLNLPATGDEVGRLAATFDMMLSRLEAAFQRERQFTADASHELRTPLTAMQTIVAVTRKQRRSPQEYEQALDDFGAVSKRLGHLVDDLLRLARGDVAIETALKPVDMTILLHGVSDAMLPLALDKGLSLSCDVPDGLELLGDGDNLVRMFVNLLDNAVKYTDRGNISVRARPLDDDIEVIVADTGIGVAPEALPYIFDRFYRVDQARSTTGSGLGLAIVQSIVQAHQGTISVESKVGAGTSFTVTLPRQRWAP